MFGSKLNTFLKYVCAALFSPCAARDCALYRLACTGTGKIDDKFAHITIIYFDSAENATASFEAVEKYSADDKDDAKDNWVFKKSGKMIYYGTTEAVKAAK